MKIENLDKIDEGITRLVLAKQCLAKAEVGSGFCNSNSEAYFAEKNGYEFVYIYCKLHAEKHKNWSIMEKLTIQDIFYLMLIHHL